MLTQVREDVDIVPANDIPQNSKSRKNAMNQPSMCDEINHSAISCSIDKDITMVATYGTNIENRTLGGNVLSQPSGNLEIAQSDCDNKGEVVRPAGGCLKSPVVRRLENERGK